MTTYTIDDARNLLSQCHEARVAQSQAEESARLAMARHDDTSYRALVLDRAGDRGLGWYMANAASRAARSEAREWESTADDLRARAEDYALSALRALLVATGDVDDDEESWCTAQDYLDEFGNGADAQTYVEARLRAIDAAAAA